MALRADAPAPHAPPTGPPTPSLLHAVLDLVDEAFAREHEGAHLLRLVSPGGGGGPLSVGLLDLGSSHPVEALAGFEADTTWAAAGVVAHGSAGGLGGPGSPPERVRAIHVVDRSGVAASAVRPLTPGAEAVHTADAEGTIPDCCRRILALPTAPCTTSVATWWAARWLDAVRADTLAEPAGPWTWERIAAHHPLAGRPHRAADTLVAVVASADAATTWEDVRAAAAARGMPGLAPDMAAWMDAGMAGRWLVGAVPDPVESVAELLPVLDAPLVEAIVATLDAWSIW